MIQLIACDLDGTLLNSDTQIRSSSRTFLRHLWHQGIVIVLATGRSWRTAFKIQQQLGIAGPIIAHNGGYIFNPSTGEDIYRRGVPVQTAKDMLRWSSDHNTMLRCYLGYQRPVVFNFFNDPHLQQFLRPEDVLLSPDAANLDIDPLEIFLFGTDEIDPFIETFGMNGPGYELVVFEHSDHQEINICAPLVDKVQALQYLCSELKLDPQQVMALGDGANDVLMLQWAGTSIAMGHGAPECQENAHYVTSKFSPDPVVEGLKWAMERGLLVPTYQDRA
ncbi:MAG: Cof-type HAD-IIB family hydrolase [Sulfobacillus sp.]